ncbi:MAG: hypothetical protein ABI376_00135 [Caulobacteraceae bacterium]
MSSTPGWGLAPKVAGRTQGLVVSPFAHLEAAEAIFLRIAAGSGGAWLAALRARVPITDATGPSAPCAAIAFAWTGLAAMGLDADALATFPPPFSEGMHQKDRRRRLTDDGAGTIDGGAIWGGTAAGPAIDGPDDTGAPAPVPPVVVHAVLLIYAHDDAALDARCAEAVDAIAPLGVTIARRLRLSLRLDANGISREHFGFADGVSQPLPFGPEIRRSDGAAAPRDPWHAVPPGEILLGHLNAHGEPAPGPLVAAPPGVALPLPTKGAPEGFADLGLDGSYLVVRELRQDVARFWGAMDAAALAAADPAVDAEWLAAKVVGRTRNGVPLAPARVAAPLAGAPANAFGYFERDPHGFGCPVGSHIRRANPRDGAAVSGAATSGVLAAANNHRILRRGRKFGPDLADPRADDGAERGLLFMCLNTDLVRQFEFVQQNWLLNPTFATLLDETDPLLGPPGRFTVPGAPVRRRVEADTSVMFAGGEYFFLPSLPALDYLETLR